MTRAALASFLLLACPSLAAAQQPARPAGAIAGVVRDTNRAPVPQVRVSAGDDTTRFAVTDSAGEFRLSSVAAGMRRVHFRRLGYVAADFTVLVEPAEELRLQVELAALPTTLDTITVSRTIITSLASVGYYERQRLREQGILNATFIDPEEIEQRRPTRTSHLFHGIPGLSVVYQETRGRSIPLLFGRTIGRSDRCQPAIFLDGVEQGGTGMPMDLDMLISPLEIRAIEVYSFGSRVPEQFQSMRNTQACGSVVIWTKVGR